MDPTQILSIDLPLISQNISNCTIVWRTLSIAPPISESRQIGAKERIGSNLFPTQIREQTMQQKV
jgi:hypothetical protein